MCIVIIYKYTTKFIDMLRSLILFYCFFVESNCGDPPALIQELSHTAMAFTELQGEKILSISCSEFFSSAMTQSGKIFWW